jgi:hypothetical protein
MQRVHPYQKQREHNGDYGTSSSNIPCELVKGQGSDEWCFIPRRNYPALAWHYRYCSALDVLRIFSSVELQVVFVILPTVNHPAFFVVQKERDRI